LKYLVQAISATVGGQPATVSFQGAAPTYIDGLSQLNIRLSENTPLGPAQPVVLKVNNVASPATATISVY
jgi:uncharacterized protein (TIGR03437 family)